MKPSDAEADVALSASALGAAFLGGRSVRRLHEAGWVDEAHAAAASTASTPCSPRPTAPWSPTTY